MNIEPKELQEVKSDFEEVHEALETLGAIWEAGEEGQKNRIAFLRALAELTRENAAARSIMEKLLDAVSGKRPEEVAVFRAYYLEGKKKPTARQIARCLCMDVRTVHRYNRRILIAMLPVAFGVEGLFYPDSDLERIKNPVRERCGLPAASQNLPRGVLNVSSE